MKTIMIVPELPCKNCHKYEPNACAECFNINGKKEQVPETWDDLKTMCEDLESKDVFITSGGDCIEFNGLLFWQDGSITTDKELVYAIKTEVTPDRMWQIIKGLIGEQ